MSASLANRKRQDTRYRLGIGCGSVPPASSGLIVVGHAGSKASCSISLSRFATRSLNVVSATNCRGVKRSLHFVIP